MEPAILISLIVQFFSIPPGRGGWLSPEQTAGGRPTRPRTRRYFWHPAPARHRVVAADPACPSSSSSRRSYRRRSAAARCPRNTRRRLNDAAEMEGVRQRSLLILQVLLERHGLVFGRGARQQGEPT